MMKHGENVYDVIMTLFFIKHFKICTWIFVVEYLLTQNVVKFRRKGKQSDS